MVKQQNIQSFFKRKWDEEAIDHTFDPDPMAIVEYVNQREDEDGQENRRAFM
jgi:hypothetical protein